MQRILPLLALLLFAFGCFREPLEPCPADQELLADFTINDVHARVYADGIAYEVVRGECRYLTQYYSPDFLEFNYDIDSPDVFIRAEDGSFFPCDNNFIEDFEQQATFLDLFVESLADTHKHWTGFTLQSPEAPEISDYVALRQCLLNGSCEFRDNLMEIVTDPRDAANHALRCFAVPPSRKMVTSKCSFESNLPFFPKGRDIWFSARYMIADGMPFSLVDFENPYFESSPGPRLVLENGALAFENKFGAKPYFRQSNPVTFPLDQWVTVKVHLHLHEGDTGLFELWQDDVLLLSTNGPTIPTRNSIQNSIEVGISATDERCILYVDDVRLSDVPF